MFTPKPLTQTDILNNTLLLAHDEHGRTIFAMKRCGEIIVTLTNNGHILSTSTETTDPADLIKIGENLPFATARRICRSLGRETLIIDDFVGDAAGLAGIEKVRFDAEDNYLITRRDGATLTIGDEDEVNVEEMITKIKAFAAKNEA